MKALGQALEERLGKDADRLFQKSEQKQVLNANQVQNAIGIKLDSLSKLLKLYPYDTMDNPGRCLSQCLRKTLNKFMSFVLPLCSARLWHAISDLYVWTQGTVTCHK